jgi:hypothetical protein
MALTSTDIAALTDRLLARGASLVFQGSPEIQRDMTLAARTIRRLLKQIESIHIISDTANVQLID